MQYRAVHIDIVLLIIFFVNHINIGSRSDPMRIATLFQLFYFEYLVRQTNVILFLEASPYTSYLWKFEKKRRRTNFDPVCLFCASGDSHVNGEFNLRWDIILQESIINNKATGVFFLFHNNKPITNYLFYCTALYCTVHGVVQHNSPAVRFARFPYNIIIDHTTPTLPASTYKTDKTKI